MLEKPSLPDHDLLSCLHREYGIGATSLEFLPLGADINTAVYRTEGATGSDHFVKLRSGAFLEASVTIPAYLSAQVGLEQVIPPVRTRSGNLWVHLAEYAVIVYPFIDGENGFNRTLSDRQMRALGAALRQLHDTPFPGYLTGSLTVESYSSRWRDAVRQYQQLAASGDFCDPVAEQLAALMRSHRDQIDQVIDRAEGLAPVIQNWALEPVVCHADIHAGNVLVGSDGLVFIVDWDTLAIAPREKDMMYIGAGIGDVWTSAAESRAFHDGYGPAAVDPDAIDYFRCERIVQDIAAFCEQLLDSDAGGEDRRQSLHYFASQFEAGGVIDIALRSDPLV